jgi:hypothetical protein
MGGSNQRVGADPISNTFCEKSNGGKIQYNKMSGKMGNIFHTWCGRRGQGPVLKMKLCSGSRKA